MAVKLFLYCLAQNNLRQGIFCKMVQKRPEPSSKPGAPSPSRGRRGRPRAYQPDVALGKALDLFRKGGFAATSLDDLSAATGMNRPSLYGAFGDKRELYIKSYQRYRDDARAAMIDVFRIEMPIRKRLERIYSIALDIYLSGEAGPRGCFTVMTAASEAVGDPQIRAMVLEGFAELDKAFARCFRLAREKGELPASTDPAVLAQIASATMHSMAIRARARVPRNELEAMAKGAIDVMCGLGANRQ
jgi:AcrR family transcriptional regulator